MENLSIYNDFRVVPQEAKKEIQAGRLKGFTDVNPMWRIKKLTERFGACGVGWYYDILEERLEKGCDNQISAFTKINLFYKVGDEWSKPIQGTGGASFVANERSGAYQSDECFKMALTDAISVACKALGMGADVYYQKDRSKYDSVVSEQQKKPEQPKIVDTKKIVFDYLSNNAKALTYYKGQHLFTTIDELTNGQINEIYNHLKNNNKL